MLLYRTDNHVERKLKVHFGGFSLENGRIKDEELNKRLSKLKDYNVRKGNLLIEAVLYKNNPTMNTVTQEVKYKDRAQIYVLSYILGSFNRPLVQVTL